MSLGRVGAYNREIVRAVGHHRVDVVEKRVGHKPEMHSTVDNPDRYPEPITANDYLMQRLREIKLA